MKIIQLFLLLSLAICAENGSNILNEEDVDTKLLQNVVENGWSDKNETLNKFIIKYKDKALPIILKIIDQPIRKVEPTKDDVYPIPETRLCKRDYWNLFSYMKYLEKEGKINQVYNIYVKSFKGLKNIPDNSIFSLIYRMAINDIIAKSLTQSINSNFFTQDKRKSLKNDLSSLLITNNELLLKTLENEKSFSLKLTKETQLKYSPSLIDEHLLKLYKKYAIISINKNYSKLSNAIIANSLDDLDKEKQTAREKHNAIGKQIKMWLLKSKIEFYNSLSIENSQDDYKILAKYIVDSDYLINTPYMDRMFKDYFELVEENKKLLKKLD